MTGNVANPYVSRAQGFGLFSQTVLIVKLNFPISILTENTDFPFSILTVARKSFSILSVHIEFPVCNTLWIRDLSVGKGPPTRTCRQILMPELL